MMKEQENHRPLLYTFLEAAGSHGKTPEHHITEKARMNYASDMRMRGTLRLKRTLLGFCGQEAIKSLDELAEALVRSGIIEEKKQVQGLMHQGLLGHPLPYGTRFGKRMDLLITEMPGEQVSSYKCVVQEHTYRKRK